MTMPQTQIPLSRAIDIPFDKLVLSPSNVRQVNILPAGLLNPEGLPPELVGLSTQLRRPFRFRPRRRRIHGFGLKSQAEGLIGSGAGHSGSRSKEIRLSSASCDTNRGTV